MEISIDSSYLYSRLNPEKQLRWLSEAGFRFVHWIHHWNTDFLYGTHEIRQIKQWLKDYGLQLHDIHGTRGQEKCWFSTEEYERKAGVELVANRVRMLAELGRGSLVMHGAFIPDTMDPAERPTRLKMLDAERRSLDELMPILDECHVKIAQENLPGDTYEFLNYLLDEYPADHFGFTYDAGHGNIREAGDRGLGWLEEHKDRLLALHLHDNMGDEDSHRLPFDGTIDWPRLMSIIMSSPYAKADKPLSFELNIRNTPYFDAEKEPFEQSEESARNFLADAYERCQRVAELADKA